jgi:hypothetical protein
VGRHARAGNRQDADRVVRDDRRRDTDQYPLHQELMLDSAFIRGGTNIHYLEEKLSKQNRPD